MEFVLRFGLFVAAMLSLLFQILEEPGHPLKGSVGRICRFAGVVCAGVTIYFVLFPVWNI